MIAINILNIGVGIWMSYNALHYFNKSELNWGILFAAAAAINFAVAFL